MMPPLRTVTEGPSFSLVHLTAKPRLSEEGLERPPLLLLLHGIGSNEADLFSLAPYLDPRFLIVSARAPVHLAPGAYAWFNLDFTPSGMIPDLEGARQSLLLLPGFIDELTSAYAADAGRVYVAGFSQGAMMSLALALSRPEKVKGVVAMSGRFPAEMLLEEGLVKKEEVAGMPMLVTHGMNDPVLPVENGHQSRKALETLGVKLTYQEYVMGHEVSLECLRDVAAWLSKELDSTLTLTTE